MEERVQQLIVTAVLEHEAISGLSSHKQPVGQSGRARYSYHKINHHFLVLTSN